MRLKRLEKPVGRTPLDEDPRSGAAVLSRVAKACERRRGGRWLEVRVRADDVCGLAAQLERDALYGARGRITDAPPYRGGAREGDLRDVEVLNESLPHYPAGHHDDVQDPFRQAPSRAIFSSSSAVSGVSSAGFNTTVLSAASAGATFQEATARGEVPGHDQADDAERLMEGHVHTGSDRDGVAEQPLPTIASVRGVMTRSGSNQRLGVI